MKTKQTRPPNVIEARASQPHKPLQPPEGCSEAFRAEWEAITGSFDPQFFRECDRTVLEQRVQCALELRTVQAVVDNLPERYIPNSQGILVLHPAVKDLETLRARFRACCIQTRTSPGSRIDGHQVGKPPAAKADPSDDPRLRRLQGLVA